jgi:hypothetical protein
MTLADCPISRFYLSELVYCTSNVRIQQSASCVQYIVRHRPGPEMGVRIRGPTGRFSNDVFADAGGLNGRQLRTGRPSDRRKSIIFRFKKNSVEAHV